MSLDRALYSASRSAKFSGVDTNYYPASAPTGDCSNAAPSGYLAGYYTDSMGNGLCIYILNGTTMPPVLPAGTAPGLYPPAVSIPAPVPIGTVITLPTPTPVVQTPTPAPVSFDFTTTIKNFYTENPVLSLGIVAAAAYFLFIKK